jgi:hypothetical protein
MAGVIDDIIKKIESNSNKIYDVQDTIHMLLEYLRMKEQEEPIYYEALNGLYFGYCVDTLDIYKQNRVRFYSPLLHEPNIQVGSLPWAMPVTGFGGIDDCGSNWIPPAGSTLAVLFEGGDRESPYYIGTTWSRLNGDTTQGGFYNIPMEEYDFLYQSRRNGYLCGPNNGTQLLPPWNTESYNGFDITSINDINNSPYLLQRMTFPNIYGFKTPEKHMIKMVDGDAKCNRKWKRIEIMSGCGNWMIMKDDHLHYCGQWAHPICGAKSGDSSCFEGQPNPPPQTVLDAGGNIVLQNPSINQSGSALFRDNEPLLTDSAILNLLSKEYPPGSTSKCKNPRGGGIIGGDADYQGKDTQVGSNPFFKQQSECRPYKGPQTPQNNSCDLPQSGIQFLSISGHSFVMDDSVEYPRGGMEWERSTKPFDFGCTDKYLGQSYWKSATGHTILMNDAERLGDFKQTRDDQNGITLLTALGNKIFLSDASSGPNCPSLATEGQGISMVSTSGHEIIMSDNQNDRKIPCRKEIGYAAPEPNAKSAYVRIRSGGGMKFEMFDGSSQQETNDESYLELLAPMTTNETTGPHIFRMQQRASQNGFIFLRAGGDYLVETFGGYSEVIGLPDDDNSIGNRVAQIKNNNFELTKEIKYTENDQFINFSKNRAIILAGQDYEQEPTEEQQQAIDAAAEAGIELPPLEKVPNICPVLVFNASTGQIVFSDRIFASASPDAVVASIYNMSPFNNLTASDIATIKDQLEIE